MNHVVINEQVPMAGALFDGTTKSYLDGANLIYTHIRAD